MRLSLNDRLRISVCIGVCSAPYYAYMAWLRWPMRREAQGWGEVARVMVEWKISFPGYLLYHLEALP